jgi:hypothetical protein
MKLTDILREVKGNLLKEYMGQDFYSDPNGNDPFILDMLMKHTLSSYPKHKVNDDPYAGIDEKGNWVLKYEFTLDQTPGIEYFAMLYIPLDILEVLKTQYEEKTISKQKFIKLIEKMISKGQARFQFDKFDGKKRTKIK